MHKRGRLPLLDYFSAWLGFLDLSVDILSSSLVTFHVLLDCLFYLCSDGYVILLGDWSIVMIRISYNKRIFFIDKKQPQTNILKTKTHPHTKYPIPQQVPNTQTQLAKHKPNKGSRQNRSLRSLQGLALTTNKTKPKPAVTVNTVTS